MTVPGSVGVLGGGRMGAGIAHAFLLAGARVHIVERDDDAAAAAQERVLSAVARSVARGQLADAAEVGSALSVGTDLAAFRSSGLVIEAVPEDPDLKAGALVRIEAAAPDAVIATNT